MKPTLAETRFEYHIGVQVDDSAEDFPKAEATKTAPGWIPHLLVLHSVVDALGGRKMLVGKYPGQAGGGEHGANKLPLVVKFLPKDGRWLARGYCNWALGIKSGKLKAIAVSGAVRTSALPDVPTFVESGLADFVVDSWVGLLAPGKTPAPILARLNSELDAVLADPAVRDRLLAANRSVNSTEPTSTVIGVVNSLRAMFSPVTRTAIGSTSTASIDAAPWRAAACTIS